MKDKPKKLVRDIFPPDNDPNIQLTRIEDKVELNKLYALKVEEEMGEIQQSAHTDIKEFADLLEVTFAWAEQNGFSSGDLLQALLVKAQYKGKITNRVLLTLNPENPSNKPYFRSHE